MRCDHKGHAGRERYNPRKREMQRKQFSMKRVWLVVFVAICLVGHAGLGVMAASATPAAPAPSQWAQPAAALAEQIAGILGPGQALSLIHISPRVISTKSTQRVWNLTMPRLSAFHA